MNSFYNDRVAKTENALHVLQTVANNKQYSDSEKHYRRILDETEKNLAKSIDEAEKRCQECLAYHEKIITIEKVKKSMDDSAKEGLKSTITALKLSFGKVIEECQENLKNLPGQNQI